jgi:hypothetical protein
MVFVIVRQERQVTRIVHDRHAENFLVPAEGFFNIANPQYEVRELRRRNWCLHVDFTFHGVAPIVL